MDLLMALRGSKHVMILFPPVTPTNISDAELLRDRMKSQPYRWVSLPIWSSSEFLSACRKLAPFCCRVVVFLLQCYYRLSHQRGLAGVCESSFSKWWGTQSISAILWIKTALKVLIYFFDCLICSVSKYIFLRDCILCFIEKAAQHC